MLETSARLLRLLSLLQMRQEWTGPELANRLNITTRTVRRDIDKLRDLGYPVEANVGVGGGYRLGAGAEMPPLLLDDQEVLAVAVGLNTVAAGGIAGIQDASAGALTKLRQVMPTRLRHRLDALSVDSVPRNASWTSIPADRLTDIATTCHRHERLRFDYRKADGTESRRDIEPYRVVRNGSRWYLIGWDLARADWRSFRIDRMEPKTPTGPRFSPRELPEGGAGAYLARSIGAVHRAATARVRVHAPLTDIAAMVSDEWATIESGDDSACELRVYSKSLTSIARWLRAFNADFDILEPEALRVECAALAEEHDRLAERYRRSITSA